MAKKEEIEVVIAPDGRLKVRVKTKHSHLGAGIHPDLKKFAEAMGGAESEQIPYEQGREEQGLAHGHE